MADQASHRLQTTMRPARVVEPRSPLSALSTGPAVTVSGTCTLAEAVVVMREKGVSALLVDGHAGIVTERDLARVLGAGTERDEPVAVAATWHPIVVPAATSVIAAAGTMLNEQVRHLLVDLGGGDVSVVSMRDLMAVLLQATDPGIWLTSLRIAIEAPTEIWLG